MPPMVPEDPEYDENVALLERRHTTRRSADEDAEAPVTGNVIAWAKAISIVGGTTAIAIMLAWGLLRSLPVVEAKTTETELIVLDIQKQISAEQTERASEYRLEFRLLQKICSNTAKSDDDRQRCFEQ